MRAMMSIFMPSRREGSGARLAEYSHLDGFVDGAGYFAYAGEVADRAE